MIRYQTVVRETNNQQRTGIVCPTAPGLEDEEGVSVVFPPSTIAEMIDEDALEIVGLENAVADLEKCGAGQGKRVCMYLVIADGALRCARFSDVRWMLRFTMRPRGLREPLKSYPDCQLPLSQD